MKIETIQNIIKNNPWLPPTFLYMEILEQQNQENIPKEDIVIIIDSPKHDSKYKRREYPYKPISKI